MRYEWDEAKSLANRIKHGIGFDAIAGRDSSSSTTETTRGGHRFHRCEPALSHLHEE